MTIPEKRIDPQTISHVASDVSSPQGQNKLFQKAVNAHVAKKQLDAIMDAVATHLGASSNSRIKNIETATKKIAQKRLEGRNYKIDDINDMLGSRLVINSEKQLAKAKQSIERLAKAGVFSIEKKQDVKNGTYAAYHYDVSLGNGTKAEIQIHTPQSEAEATVNHSLRDNYGENAHDQAVTALKQKQHDLVKKLPNERAKAVTGAVQQLIKRQDGQLHPQQGAEIITMAHQA